MKSDSRTSDSLNVSVNQTIKLAGKKQQYYGWVPTNARSDKLQHIGELERLLKTGRQLSNVLVKKYYS